MNIVEHLQSLDALIIEHTKPPVTAILRRELHVAMEQCEAYQASSDKQDETLARQIETIDRQMKENAELVKENAKIKADHEKAFEDWFEKKARTDTEFRQTSGITIKRV